MRAAPKGTNLSAGPGGGMRSWVDRDIGRGEEEDQLVPQLGPRRVEALQRHGEDPVVDRVLSPGAGQPVDLLQESQRAGRRPGIADERLGRQPLRLVEEPVEVAVRLPEPLASGPRRAQPKDAGGEGMRGRPGHLAHHLVDAAPGPGEL